MEENTIKKGMIFLLILLFISGCSAPLTPLINYNPIYGKANAIPYKADLNVEIVNVHKRILNDTSIASIKRTIEKDLEINLLNLTSLGNYEIEVEVKVNLLNYKVKP